MLPSVKYKNITWLNAENPSVQTLDYLAKEYEFHPLDIEDILSENQRAKIDEHQKYLFILLYFPFLNKKTRNIDIAQFALFISNDFLITISSGDCDFFKKFFDECRKSIGVRKKFMGNGTPYLLYEMLDRAFDNVFLLVDNLELEGYAVEKELFLYGDDQRDKLKDILLLKKDILMLKRAIAPQRQVIVQLEHKLMKFLPQKLEIYFDNLVDKAEKIWSNLDSLNEIITSVENINESVISHNTTNTIKVLTIFSVTMMPMTVITGFFGMNVNLPLAQQAGGHPLNFLFIFLLMLAISGILLVFFRFKRWL